MAKIFTSSTKTNRVERETGELLESVETTYRVLKKQQEFVYSMWFGNAKTTEGLSVTELRFLLALSPFLAFDTGEIDLSTVLRKRLAEELGVTIATIRNVISKLVKLKYLQKMESGIFRISPFLLYKGDLGNLIPLRKEFMKHAA
ncbi:replication/maintenance protein RepL [Pseudoalteromonas sp. MM17-2]|uniref:replication/maintenance protein RepL n=1 Tax=Pseudoalteromonas sp. MM17-2 TaxID=2917753 RepID=UPI001EF4535B|nr:replication/maintenance protein RepL [Pseudoalteromonas sp. MM17-2]MCG7546261.1 replication/maintenance protein RepL [Pseudoalteromonas sp. MM17-2]